MVDRKALIERYGKAIVHLRQALHMRRLGLALGAGVSLGMDLPSWATLLKDIKDKLQTLGVNVHYDPKSRSEPAQAQILFSAYRAFILTTHSALKSLEAVLQEAEVAARWRSLVHGVLYEKMTDVDAKLDKHPYMRELAALAKRLRFVVSYNFDDMLERALARNAKRQPDSRTVGYVSAWGPNFVIQDDRPVIYHPNGFLPFDLVDRSSEQVILTEESLSDQALDFSMGVYQTLLEYFSRSPALLLGFSLADPALRSLLRQTLRHAPGIVHYCIHWCGRSRPSPEEQREISESNFDLFGIVTLFLDDEELRFVLQLIVEMSDDDFKQEFYEAGVPDKYKYYVAGVVSVGKTTAISTLKGLAVVDEWLTLRNPLIAKRSDDLTTGERLEVDKWIMGQLRLKNQRFRNAAPGLHIMDRAPLDAFAFTPPAELSEKAEMLWKEVCVGFGAPEPFERGQLLLIKGRAADLVVRQCSRGRGGDVLYLEHQQEKLLDVYSIGEPGVCLIDGGGLTAGIVARRIAKAIHFGSYEEFDFDAGLQARRKKT